MYLQPSGKLANQPGVGHSFGNHRSWHDSDPRARAGGYPFTYRNAGRDPDTQPYPDAASHEYPGDAPAVVSWK